MVASGATEGVRILVDFTDPARIARLQSSASGCRLQPIGNPDGATNQTAAQLTVMRGEGWAQFLLEASDLADWTGSEIVALDVDAGADAPAAITLELWDPASRNYATRCSLDMPIRAGRQTVTWRIDRARRNGKEGLDWYQLAKEDKIDLAHLKQVKFILQQDPGRERSCRLYNLRLTREDALRPSMQFNIPGSGRRSISVLRRLCRCSSWSPPP